MERIRKLVTHGRTRGVISGRVKEPRLYRTWIDMKQRCHNPNNKAYPRYGGRGITVCDEWRNDYAAFEAWAISNGYKDNLTIDKIDNDKGYSPDNCQWITQSENSKLGAKKPEKIKEISMPKKIKEKETPPETEADIKLLSDPISKQGRIQQNSVDIGACVFYGITIRTDGENDLTFTVFSGEKQLIPGDIPVRGSDGLVSLDYSPPLIADDGLSLVVVCEGMFEAMISYDNK